MFSSCDFLLQGAAETAFAPIKRIEIEKDTEHAWSSDNASNSGCVYSGVCAGAGTRSDECGLLVKPNQECRAQRKS
jgi:hypothetical protein